VEFANLILICIVGEQNILNSIIFCGEATFYVSGHVNCHNCRIWVIENPHMAQELIHDILKRNVWCRLMCDHVFWPFIFVENTVNRQVYMEMLENFFFPQLEESDFTNSIILRHDGKLPHFPRHVVEVLTAAFPEGGLAGVVQFCCHLRSLV
jgi:hypothetical protein